MYSKKLSDILKQGHVHMKHPDVVEKKLEMLVSDGTNHLQVISDFDMTISKYKHLNKRCPSTHNVLETNSMISDDIKKELHDLKEKYYAIEIDHNLSKDEKVPHMIKWWTTVHEILAKTRLNKSHLRRSVSESEIKLRDGCDKLIEILYQHNVPLLIFSAGVGDVLREALEQKSHFHPNMEIVSNFMDFDEQGYLTGFKGRLIHTFNKNESALEGDDYFELLTHRHNVILMGDMLGDTTMADGVANLQTCLKIGFLNAKFDELLDQFMDAWDIVLVDDQTMDVANGIIGEALNEQST